MIRSETFARFRALVWLVVAGILGFYFYGLVLGLYGPLELGLLSIACLTLLVLFAMHELALRRELHKHPREVDHTDKERRGF